MICAGFVYLKMGQFDTAIDDYSSALGFDPKLATALYGRGLAKRKKGDPTWGRYRYCGSKNDPSKDWRRLRALWRAVNQRLRLKPQVAAQPCKVDLMSRDCATRYSSHRIT